MAKTLDILNTFNLPLHDDGTEEWVTSNAYYLKIRPANNPYKILTLKSGVTIKLPFQKNPPKTNQYFLALTLTPGKEPVLSFCTANLVLHEEEQEVKIEHVWLPKNVSVDELLDAIDVWEDKALASHCSRQSIERFVVDIEDDEPAPPVL